MKSIHMKTVLRPEKIEIDRMGVDVRVRLHPAGRNADASGNVFRTHFNSNCLQPELSDLLDKVARIAGESIDEVSMDEDVHTMKKVCRMIVDASNATESRDRRMTFRHAAALAEKVLSEMESEDKDGS